MLKLNATKRHTIFRELTAPQNSNNFRKLRLVESYFDKGADRRSAISIRKCSVTKAFFRND